MHGQLFAPGRIVMTPGVEALFESGALSPDILARHIRGDWGELDGHDIACNHAALVSGDRLHSVYSAAHGEEVWVISDAVPDGWDPSRRAVTTLLLPDEYRPSRGPCP